MWSRERELAEEAARRAGARLRQAMSGAHEVLSEAGRDIKLQLDRDAEADILQVLRESGYGVLAEESGEHGLQEEDAPRWVVDPLDGTFNFHRGLPLCCVSIGLMRGSKPVLGVIHDFVSNRCYSGIVGEGAWCDGVPMQVSGVRDVRQAVLMTGLPTAGDYSQERLQAFIAECQRFKKIRALGTAALMLALVASGQADAYDEQGVKLWDVAAGLALVEAAGGVCRVEPFGKEPWMFHVRAAADASLWPQGAATPA